MWTKEHRAKALARPRERKCYPCDLTDDEWSVIAPLMRDASRIGRPRSVDLREVINAVRYLVLCWFRRFVCHLTFRVVHDIALMMVGSRSISDQGL